MCVTVWVELPILWAGEVPRETPQRQARAARISRSPPGRKPKVSRSIACPLWASQHGDVDLTALIEPDADRLAVRCISGNIAPERFKAAAGIRI